MSTQPTGGQVINPGMTPEEVEFASGGTAKVKLSDAQVTALQTSGIFEDVEPGSDEEHLVNAIKGGNTLHVTKDTVDRIAGTINELSNHNDDIAQNEQDPDRKKWASADAKTLSNLYSKVLGLKKTQAKGETA